MKRCIGFVCLAFLGGTNLVHSAEPPKVAGYETKTVEGWTLLISDDLFEKDKAGTERALELLAVCIKSLAT